jgi:spore coat protein U-like protein
MNIRIPILAALTSFVLWPGTAAVAQTATTQFDVRITITAQCLLSSLGEMNFGTNGIISAAINATTAITVLCTNGTNYNIGLNAGLGIGATLPERRMTGPAGAIVSYFLYKNTQRTAVWGAIGGSDTQAGTGTGVLQTYTVYGQVPAQTTPAPGAYTDTITATLTY